MSQYPGSLDGLGTFRRLVGFIFTYSDTSPTLWYRVMAKTTPSNDLPRTVCLGLLQVLVGLVQAVLSCLQVLHKLYIGCCRFHNFSRLAVCYVSCSVLLCWRVCSSYRCLHACTLDHTRSSDAEQFFCSSFRTRCHEVGSRRS